MTMCDKCGKSKCCCVKTIRGPKGIQGLVGPRGATGATGPQGPAGPSGTLNGTLVTFFPEQSIDKADGLTPITGATRNLTDGMYMVWVEFDLLNMEDDTNGTYGIYLDNVLQDDARQFGTTDVSGWPIHHYHKMVINGIVTVTGTQTLTVQIQLTEGIVEPHAGSILYQQIS